MFGQVLVQYRKILEYLGALELLEFPAILAILEFLAILVLYQ
jgi:hypothetical protein